MREICAAPITATLANRLRLAPTDKKEDYEWQQEPLDTNAGDERHRSVVRPRRFNPSDHAVYVRGSRTAAVREVRISSFAQEEKAPTIAGASTIYYWAVTLERPDVD